MPTNAQFDSQLEMLAQVVEAKARTGKEAAEIIRSFKTIHGKAAQEAAREDKTIEEANA